MKYTKKGMGGRKAGIERGRKGKTKVNKKYCSGRKEGRLRKESLGRIV